MIVQTITRTAKPYLTLSFSGGGHLLPYQLGVAGSLHSHYAHAYACGGGDARKKLPPIRAVAGSSSGAIAAAMFCHLPHRIQDYAELFIQERGHALELLRNLMYEEEAQVHKGTMLYDKGSQSDSHFHTRRPNLYVCTTKCKDGSPHIFEFDYPLFSSISTSWKNDEILDCVRASCTIPTTFHPFDMFGPTSTLSYPDTDGIQVEGSKYFVADGGIALPAPTTPFDANPNASRIVISPISGPGYFRISPNDDSFGSSFHFKCRGDFSVRPSHQNLKALRVAMGAASSDELKKWFHLGISDGEKFVSNFPGI